MLIGQISINISLFFYLILFIPQLQLNRARKTTVNFSVSTHGFLCIGYLSDLIYGFGCQMQWQYKMVSLVGLFCLLIQHYQYYSYGLSKSSDKKAYYFITVLSFVWVCYLVSAVCFQHPDRAFYDRIGLCATFCWTLCMLPQIIQNYSAQSTDGLSLSFVIISFIIKICDIISSWVFNWDYPSKIGSIIFFCGSVILLLQVRHYARKIKQSTVVAYC